MKTLLTIFILALSGLFVPALASAQGIPALTVVFQNSPLFANNDFKPLDRMCRWVEVTNLSNVTQPVTLETINITGCESGPFCLADRLRLEVSRTSDAVELYEAYLSAFYDAGEVIIDQIIPEATKRYDFCVTFDSGPDEDNDYQVLETGFDLLVGYQGAETNTSTGSEPAGLMIRRQATAVATSTGGIIVTWTTSYPATSQVVYGLTSGGPYTLNLSLPNYGYPSATPEDPTKVLSHSVYLSGLTPGQSYRYRVVSHASPPTVGYEFEFTVPETEEFQESYGSAVVTRLPETISPMNVVHDAHVAFVQPGLAQADLPANIAPGATFSVAAPEETKRYIPLAAALLLSLALLVFIRHIFVRGPVS